MSLADDCAGGGVQPRGQPDGSWLITSMGLGAAETSLLGLVAFNTLRRCC